MTPNIPTYALAFSPDGSLLARGGEAGLDINDLITRKRIAGMPHEVPPSAYGPVVALKWASIQGQPDMLFIGTKHGVVFAWQQNRAVYEECHVFRVPEGGEILSMAVRSSPSQIQLVLSTANGVLASYDVRPNRLWKEWSQKLVEIEPRTIEFATSGKSIIIFSTYSGQIHGFLNGEGLWDHGPRLDKLIGRVTVNENGEVAINDSVNFCIHDSRTGVLLAMFHSGIKVSTVPKHVLFGEDEEIVMAGSDAGSIYVFQKTGHGLEQVLTNGNCCNQIVATLSTASMNYIACATSSTTSVGAVAVWTRKREVAVGVSMLGPLWRLLWQIWWLFRSGNAWLLRPALHIISSSTLRALSWSFALLSNILIWLAKVCLGLSLLLVIVHFLWSKLRGDIPEVMKYAIETAEWVIWPIIVAGSKHIANFIVEIIRLHSSREYQ
ncbi:hypothetical protein PUNSTDRAFT_139539 [Punctularia strigosozonata HHB-11173 SS5]|uniref:WD40 repeat-like protein n=1 Tax=Punctularia strigosozonata (strain HHB-11173) TaxID=741275 RepID=R7RZN7_PUNST|nr:uncharacterized protein PUNSTDRAFT_139539 [Punctularia strigosozonata HHB-11173 SS5]EIN03448.1 hypothetical protein PUNSTDRAFT_139539 [Punctularia strigosozonata HHB-11173 SS5]